MTSTGSRLDVEGRELVHHERLNAAWAALLEPGMQTAVFIDPRTRAGSRSAELVASRRRGGGGRA